MQNLSKESKSELYDILYDYASLLLEKDNPCAYKNGKCAGHKNGCCSNPKCKHLSKIGCKVKALSCKLWLCDIMREKHPELYKKLYKLQYFCFRIGLYGIRKSKEEILNRRW